MRNCLILILPFLISCEAQTPDVRTLWHNRQAVKMHAAKNLEASQQELLEAFQYDPFQPELHLNLGLNLELRKENEKALQQYTASEKYAVNVFQKFVSRFNRAQLLGQNKKIVEALNEYQRALEIVPTSKEVKTNIELLMQNQQSQNDQQKNDQQQQDGSQNQQDQKKDPKDQKDQQDQKDDPNKSKEDQKKEYKPNPKYQPREFKGELSPSDVKKILDEIKQQEQKIRAEYNKKNDYKERPRDKDW